jgi:histidine triad (HIT) family protein
MKLMKYDISNIFARIIRGELPCYKVYEDANVLAFLDAFPCTPGHTLVIPKVTGYSDLSELPDDVAGHLGAALPRVARAVKAAMNADAVNILQNVGAASGQVVMHPHYHVIPRKTGDGLVKHPPSAKTMLVKEQADAVLEAFKGKL